MASKGRRSTDHDSSTRLYIAQIEATYNIDIQISLMSINGIEPHRMQTCAVYRVDVDENGEDKGVLLARGPVSTHHNANFNANVRYLLTVAMLRLMEEAAASNHAPFVRPSDGL